MFDKMYERRSCRSDAATLAVRVAFSGVSAPTKNVSYSHSVNRRRRAGRRRDSRIHLRTWEKQRC